MLIISKNKYCHINQSQVCGYCAKQKIQEFLKDDINFEIYFEGSYTSKFLEQAFSDLDYPIDNIFDKMHLATQNEIIEEIIYNLLKNNNEKIKTK